MEAVYAAPFCNSRAASPGEGMRRSEAEIRRVYVRSAGKIGALLADLYGDFVLDEPGRSKVIWDLSATAWMLQRDWLQTELTSSPVLTSELTWSRDHRRHLIRVTTRVDRDQIFADLFRRLAEQA